MTANDNEIVVYQPDETVRLDVRLDGDTVWLTQNQMTDLFQRDRTVITRHINNVFSEGELDEKSNVHFLHIPFSDKPVKVYSLNVIISVGYRVKSIRGTQFRIWATNVLREYLLRGYVVNTRLAQLEDKVDRRLAKTEADVAELKGKVDFFVQTKEPPLQGDCNSHATRCEMGEGEVCRIQKILLFNRRCKDRICRENAQLQISDDCQCFRCAAGRRMR